MAWEKTLEKPPQEPPKEDEVSAPGFMSEYPRIGLVILFVNALGCMAYVYWLVREKKRIFYAQDGVFYLLPLILFIFVFIFILSKPPKPEEEKKPEGESAQQSAGAEEKKG
ncbi:MAG TPA: hypothetical protein PLT67_10480 [Kiritimatiellia bacterium]|nr:hypothetical protein [Kiritimatiellia bacterium]